MLQSSSLHTRHCTEVFFSKTQCDSQIIFCQKEVPLINRFQQSIFRSHDRFSSEQIMSYLQAMLQQEVNKKFASKPLKEEKKVKRALGWKEKVNKKRAFIQRVIRNQSSLTLRGVAKYTGCSWTTVKKVKDQLVTKGRVEDYEYNNLKKPEEMKNLLSSIQQIEDTGLSVSDLKRKHPQFSKSKILETMHSLGLKYKPLPRERKAAKNNPPNSARVCRVITHLTQGLADPLTEVLYCDEMKFPLFQTSTHAWTCQPDSERPVYNRRPDETILTAICLCSTTAFVAVQIFIREVAAPDVLYFLNKAISALPTGRSYTVLLDNLATHHAKIIQKAEVGKFLYFNEPRMYMLNIIENAFSFVRSGFRKRVMVDSIEEESKLIIDLFFDERNMARFTGLLRNHLRQLIKYYTLHAKLGADG
jgi:hypothetical protein